MKISFSTLGCPDYNVDQVIELAASSGYDGVEIRLIRGEVDLTSLEEFSPAHIAQTRAKFEDAGISVACLDTSVKFFTADPGDISHQLEETRAQAELAAGLGAPYFRVFAGPVEGAPADDTVLDGIARGLSQASDIAAQHGVTAILETHGTLSTSASILDVLARGAGDRLGILWDVLHTYRNGDTLADAFVALGDRIKHVHLKDSATRTPGGSDYVLTGTGVLPLAETLDLLDKGGYDGFISFEWEKAWVPALEAPEIAIPQFATAVRG